MRRFRRSVESVRCCMGCSPAEPIWTRCPRNILGGTLLAQRRSSPSTASVRRAKCSTAASTISTARRWPAVSARSSRTFRRGHRLWPAEIRGQGNGRHQHAGNAPHRRGPLRHSRRSTQFKFDLWKTFGIESAATKTSGITNSTCAWPSPPSPPCTPWACGSEVEPCVILSHEYMGMPTVSGRDPRRRAKQLPHHLLRPRSRPHAPRRASTSRPRHHVLQRHAHRHRPGPSTSKTSSAIRAGSTSMPW